MNRHILERIFDSDADEIIDFKFQNPNILGENAKFQDLALDTSHLSFLSFGIIFNTLGQFNSFYADNFDSNMINDEQKDIVHENFVSAFQKVERLLVLIDEGTKEDLSVAQMKKFKIKLSKYILAFINAITEYFNLLQISDRNRYFRIPGVEDLADYIYLQAHDDIQDHGDHVRMLAQDFKPIKLGEPIAGQNLNKLIKDLTLNNSALNIPQGPANRGATLLSQFASQSDLDFRK